MLDIKNKLIQIIDDLVNNTGINSSSLITEDGLVIAVNSKQNDDDENIYLNFAAISASILAIAERGIEIINKNKNLEQIIIDAGVDINIEADITIIVTRIYSNVLLLVNFPKRLNIGLIHYEISNVITQIKELIQKDSSREIFSSVGSLL